MIRTQPHFVKGNEAHRMPRRFLYFDTEATSVRAGSVVNQSWRLGVTCFEHRDNDKRQWIKPRWNVWSDPGAMWQYISDCTAKRTRTVVLAHNIGYDLRLSGAFRYLPRLGWETDLLSIGGRNLTMTLHRNTATLALVDFVGFMPMGLQVIGDMLGLPKLDLPDEDDTWEAWVARCERDVAILHRANREILEWVETNELGNWQRTGASMAWASWRHKHYTHKVLIHADDAARAAEVAAIGTGRCEAWRWGDLDGKTHTEWDLPMAYPRIAKDTSLPTRLLGHVAKPTMAWYQSERRNVRALVRATVTTEVPILHTVTDAGFLWPVGTFTGWWWDHELDLALTHGEEVKLHEAYLYRGDPALAKWARWVIDVVENPNGPYTAVVRAAAKHWSRALPGRFGLKYPVWEEFADAPIDEISVGSMYDVDTDRMGSLLTVGGKTYFGLDSEYGTDANPAMMGAILAECRVRLWRLLGVAGHQHVAYMDTDSLITDAKGSANLRAWLKDNDGYGLRPKSQWRNVTLLGPRQLVLDGSVRLSGVPRRAERIADRTFQGQRWDGVQTTLASGTPEVIRLKDTTWEVNGQDRRRVHLPGGKTEPVRVTLEGAA